MKNMRLGTLVDLRQRFWGKQPSQSERREKVLFALEEARANYLKKERQEGVIVKDNPNRLLFLVDGVEVCEQSYANMGQSYASTQ